MKRLKEILCDVVLYTYGKNCNPKYYGFSIEVSDKNQKSFHGYLLRKRTIF